MYGTDEVVFALNSYLSSLTEENIYKQVDSFLDVMLLARKDMCGETKINRGEILLNTMQDKTEVQKFKYMKLNNLELLGNYRKSEPELFNRVPPNSLDRKSVV